ncbi:helix-turn-helix transcriptional regulator [Pandoraea sp.]|uniref:helix-turn-helix transcriptional regulator n=1 Tax=Pandoraea sp. TaxID=1883445 RepID=UPI001222613B|nr:helix-turn-helix transcriptional regulator [Pandoraea sp.]TAL57237.1 MAG: AraC family transcriptional regulator [Pandoraea sp.]TAM16515.1 MAG: AraC family transcriptional regulator [Pandoraea sp.]
MAKIALELAQALSRRATTGAAGNASRRRLAQGDGWAVDDVICTAGPQDRAFEERHETVSIAIVLAGNFQYRSVPGRALMTPGSVLLGNAGRCFECGHEHGAGDRCLAFRYAPDTFERLYAEAGARGPTPEFRHPSLPALRALAPLVAQACAGLSAPHSDIAWEELALRLAAQTVRVAWALPEAAGAMPRGAEARVAQSVREIEHRSGTPLSLSGLAGEAGLSPYHFLRTFERVTGLTPHQYLRRTRLRNAAARLLSDDAKILDVALDSGFGDVSNFNHAFRAEFGLSPRAYRRQGAPRASESALGSQPA